jgi:hypothetical protein
MLGFAVDFVAVAFFVLDFAVAFVAGAFFVLGFAVDFVAVAFFVLGFAVAFVAVAFFVLGFAVDFVAVALFAWLSGVKVTLHHLVAVVRANRRVGAARDQPWTGRKLYPERWLPPDACPRKGSLGSIGVMMPTQPSPPQQH